MVIIMEGYSMNKSITPMTILQQTTVDHEKYNNSKSEKGIYFLKENNYVFCQHESNPRLQH